MFFSILYYPDVKIINQGFGMVSTQPVPLRELILDILRSSIRVSLAFISSFWIINFYRSLKKEKFDIKKSVVDIVRSFSIGLIIILLIYFLIGAITK
jgi:hypothetical protein